MIEGASVRQGRLGCLPWLLGALVAVPAQRACKRWLFYESQYVESSPALGVSWDLVGLIAWSVSRK